MRRAPHPATLRRLAEALGLDQAARAALLVRDQLERYRGRAVGAIGIQFDESQNRLAPDGLGPWQIVRVDAAPLDQRGKHPLAILRTNRKRP